MTKPELEKLVKQYNEAVKEALNRVRIKGIRGDDVLRHCMYCKAIDGEQHPEWCVMWPLIEARAEYNKLIEAEKQDDLL